MTNSNTLKFTLLKNKYTLSNEDIKEIMKDEESEMIRKHYVIINHKRFPVKQVIEKVLDLDRLLFTSQAALNILRRLGFSIGTET